MGHRLATATTAALVGLAIAAGTSAAAQLPVVYNSALGYAQSSPTATQGETGCTRGPPSSRSVAWYMIRPCIRSRAKAARSGSAAANSAQVAMTRALVAGECPDPSERRHGHDPA